MIQTRETARAFRWIALGVFALAFALRLLHVLAIRRAPFFALLMGDAKAYDEWAVRLAGGDWIGREVFYQAPLYPYLLGVVYRFAGRDLLLVRLLQAAIGSASCVLLASAVRRVWSNAAGAIAGVLLAIWAPAIFFDGLIQKSVLDVFFVCLVIWLIAGPLRTTGTQVRLKADATSEGNDGPPRSNRRRVRLQTDPSDPRHDRPIRLQADPSDRRHDRPVRLQTDRWWLALGLALGALALTRENALVLIAVVLAWAVVRRPPWRHAALVAAGLAIVLVPVAARNRAVGGGFFITTAQLGPNFYIGNNPKADGTYASLRYGRGAPEYERQDATALAEHALGRPLTPGEISSYWTDRALDFITTDPAAWLRLTARKAALLVNRIEMVDTESQESHAEWSWPLRVLGPVTTFGVLVPLALVGLVVARPWRSPLGLLAALTVAYAASVVLFYVFARYRYPLVPLLMVFASIGLSTVLAAASGRPEDLRDETPASDSAVGSTFTRRRPVVARAFRPAIAIGAAGAVLANWPLLSPALMRAVTESNVGVALQEARRYDEAIAHYRRALELRPAYPPAYNNLATALRAAGQLDEAVATYRRALELRPDFPDAQYNLANVLVEQGRAGEAIDYYRSALRSEPASVDVHTNLGVALAARGSADEALTEFRAALAADPDSARAHRNLADLLAARGATSEAIAHLQQAARLSPDEGAIRYDLGSLLLEAGRAADAIPELREAVARLPASAEARNNLGIALGSEGRFDEATAQFRDALRIRPDFADARQNLALALSRAKPR